MNNNTNAKVLYGIFLVTNLLLYLLGQLEGELLLLVIIISSYYVISLASFDYKNIKTYFYPVLTVIIYSAYMLKQF